MTNITLGNIRTPVPEGAVNGLTFDKGNFGVTFTDLELILDLPEGVTVERVETSRQDGFDLEGLPIYKTFNYFPTTEASNSGYSGLNFRLPNRVVDEGIRIEYNPILYLSTSEYPDVTYYLSDGSTGQIALTEFSAPQLQSIRFPDNGLLGTNDSQSTVAVDGVPLFPTDDNDLTVYTGSDLIINKADLASLLNVSDGNGTTDGIDIRLLSLTGEGLSPVVFEYNEEVQQYKISKDAFSSLESSFPQEDGSVTTRVADNQALTYSFVVTDTTNPEIPPVLLTTSVFVSAGEDPTPTVDLTLPPPPTSTIVQTTETLPEIFVDFYSDAEGNDFVINGSQAFQIRSVIETDLLLSGFVDENTSNNSFTVRIDSSSVDLQPLFSNEFQVGVDEGGAFRETIQLRPIDPTVTEFTLDYTIIPSDGGIPRTVSRQITVNNLTAEEASNRASTKLAETFFIANEVLLSATKTSDGASGNVIGEEKSFQNRGGLVINESDYTYQFPTQNASVMTDPQGGQVTIKSVTSANGSFVVNDVNNYEVKSRTQDASVIDTVDTREFVYQPNTDFTGYDVVTVTFVDADGYETVRQFTHFVYPVNNNIQYSGDVNVVNSFDYSFDADITDGIDNSGVDAFDSDTADLVRSGDLTKQSKYDDNLGSAVLENNFEFLSDISLEGATEIAISKSDLLSIYSTADGSTLDISNIQLVVDIPDPQTGEFFITPYSVSYDEATDLYTVFVEGFTDFGATAPKLVYTLTDGSGVQFPQQVIQLDQYVAPESVVEQGVEGVDFLYANALKENRDNDRILKRGEDEITGHYWVNNRDSSLTDNLVDGGEYAVIMGRRGELTADLTADEIIGGLESGDFVATKSFTSYGGYAVNAAFADGQIDSLVESANPDQTNNLTIGRIDANTGELITGFGGALRNVTGAEIWDNFDPSRSLSGRNDNAYGDILAQQNEQTGGF